MREPSMTEDSPNNGCVWSVQSSEAELWDVWTDIHCNDGLLLMDSITAAGHCDGVRGGTRNIPAPSYIHHSLISQRSGWDRTSNL
ncbi:hypothetical protein PO909_028805 [Leuciscus waleckii]